MKKTTTFETDKCYLISYISSSNTYHIGFAIFDNGNWVASDVLFVKPDDEKPWEYLCTNIYRDILVIEAYDFSMSPDEYKRIRRGDCRD